MPCLNIRCFRLTIQFLCFVTAANVIAQVPSLISPTNGSTDVTIPVTLDWSDIPEADRYQAQVSSSSLFTHPVHSETTTNSYSNVSGLNDGALYFWRARGGVDTLGTTYWGDWSAKWSFTTYCPPAGVPQPGAPDNGSKTTAAPLFDWTVVGNFQEFELEVDDDISFGSPEIAVTRDVSFYQSNDNNLIRNTQYNWRVRTIGDCDTSAWSDTWIFTFVAYDDNRIFLSSISPSPSNDNELSVGVAYTIGIGLSLVDSVENLAAGFKLDGVDCTISSDRTGWGPLYDWDNIFQFRYVDRYDDGIAPDTVGFTGSVYFDGVLPPGEYIDAFQIGITIDQPGTFELDSLMSIGSYPDYWYYYLTNALFEYPIWDGPYVFQVVQCCTGYRGNANGDLEDRVNISDVTYLISYLFGIPSGPAPECIVEGNANGDPEERINISDVTYLINYLFGIPVGPRPPNCP